MNLKKVLCSTIACMMVGSTALVQASEPQDVLSEIEMLSDKYGVEILIAENTSVDLPKVTKEELIKMLEDAHTQEDEPPIVHEFPEMAISVEPKSPLMRITDDSYTWSKWAPLRPLSSVIAGSIASLTVFKECTATFGYEYPFGGTPEFIDCYDIVSSISGVGAEGWEQTSSVYNFATTNNYNDTLKVKITGYGYLGIEYEGLPLSVKSKTETWNFSLRLDP